MKYTVKCSCGHEIEVNIYGKESERESKIKWYETEAVCPECYKSKMENERKAAADGLNLPELEGSEKQVAWAEKIRAAFIRSYESTVNTYAKGTQEQREATKKAIDAATANPRVKLYKKVIAVFEEKSAKWWIENRD